MRQLILALLLTTAACAAAEPRPDPYAAIEQLGSPENLAARCGHLEGAHRYDCETTLLRGQLAAYDALSRRSVQPTAPSDWLSDHLAATRAERERLDMQWRLEDIEADRRARDLGGCTRIRCY